MASSSAPASVPNHCDICHESLIINTEHDDYDEEIGEYMDDLEIVCKHHFHWSCFSEYYMANAYNKSHCPICQANIRDPSTHKLLVTIRNEGGLQEGYDLGALLDEEEFLEQNPEEMRKRAFLEFCAEGDEDAVVGILSPDPDPEHEHIDINCQDHETGQTGLHVALLNGRKEIIRLLLKNHADPTILDAQGKSVVDLSREMGISAEEMQSYMPS